MDNNDDVTKTFAGMLAELEDVATALAVRQSSLAKELDEVSAELDRVEAVRAAMTGKAPKKKGRRSYGSGSGYKPSPVNVARVEKIKTWAEGRGEFRGGDAADAVDMSPQRIGPILAGMARRGDLIAHGEGKARLYSLA